MSSPRFKAPGDRTKFGKRHTPGVMNQTESVYAEILQARKIAGEVIEWQFEAVTFKLAKDCRYTPDFAVLLADCSMEFIDAKGGMPRMDDASRVKIKAAAEKFPQFQFVIEKRQPKKAGGGFKRELF